MAELSNDVFTVRCLGRQGRFGNQFFQYIFARTYALRHRLKYQVGRWIGQDLFGHDDPPVTEYLPTYMEHRRDTKHEGFFGETCPPNGDEVRGHDFQGYAQFHTSYYQPLRQEIRDLFLLAAPVVERLWPIYTKLRSMGNTTVALHMRRGDTGRFIFYITPNEWYLRWLDEHWDKLDKPVLFIASENPGDAQAFAQYNPVTSADLLPLSDEPYGVYNYLRPELDKPTTASMDWFPDWFFLSKSDIMLLGNSTFGFTAAMVNSCLRECWRSRLSTQAFEKIDPWDSYPLTREDLRDYPGIIGTEIMDNPMWRGGETIGRE